MSKPLKPRRGTTAEQNAFVGEAYEITYDTDKNTIVCRDGLTAGGFPLAKEEEVSSLDSSLRAFIAQEVAKALAAANAAQSSADAKLPLAGGEMAGTINFEFGSVLGTGGEYAGAELNGNKITPEQGATFAARAPDAKNSPNCALILARDGQNISEVKLSPEGWFTKNAEVIHAGNAEYTSGYEYNQVRIHLFDKWYIEAGANWGNVKEVTFYTYDEYSMWYDVASWPTGDASDNYAPGIASNGGNYITVHRMSRDATGGPFYFIRIGALA